VVANVGRVDVARRVDGQAVDAIELPIGRTLPAPLGDEGAIGSELLDAGILEIGDLDVAGGINC
jgi:hypothetical protein